MAAIAVDRIDRKIMTRLQADGRTSNQTLAAAVGLSASACLSRTRRLEKAGVILGYNARIAIERIRPTLTIFAEVTLGQHHPADFAAFERFIGGVPEIVEAAQVSGQFDYLMQVIVGDMTAWRDLSDRILTSDLGVGKISSHILMKQAKEYQPVGL